MIIRKFEGLLVNFYPARGTMPGKIRPAIVIQRNSLNKVGHPSTLVIPISSKDYTNTSILRIKIDASLQNGLEKPSHAVIDQLTAIDNSKIKLTIIRRSHSTDKYCHTITSSSCTTTNFQDTGQ